MQLRCSNKMTCMQKDQVGATRSFRCNKLVLVHQEAQVLQHLRCCVSRPCLLPIKTSGVATELNYCP